MYVIKSHLPVNNVPWDLIHKDCDSATDVPPLIYGEFMDDSIATIQLHQRRDLEDWTLSFRDEVSKLIKPLLWADANYNDVADGCWFARYKQGGYVDWHKHEPYVDLVAVWYLQGTGTLAVQHQGKIYNIETAPGDLLVFPGTLLHSTLANQSDVDRIIMSVDLCLTRQTMKKLVQLKSYNQDQVDKIYKERQEQLFIKIKEHNEINPA